MKKLKLVYGVGINDADYSVTSEIKIDGKRKTLWRCPFYVSWSSMLRRCYSEKTHKERPSYSSCYAVESWHYFMTFRAWMETQNWVNKELDKDLLFPGNKLYGPETCVFVERSVNSFILERQNDRGQWPIGVYFDNISDKFIGKGREVLTGKRRHLGCFNSPEEAYQAWLAFKLEQAKILASQQSDPRVAAALVDRYENYQNVQD